MAFGRLHRHTCLQTLVTKNTTRHAYVSVNFKCYHSSPGRPPGNFSRQIPGGWASLGPLILINCTLLHHFQDLNHYLPIEYLQIRIENTSLSKKTIKSWITESNLH